MTPFQVELPYSKSITNRLLILQALSEAAIEIHGCADSTDTVRLSEILKSNAGLVDAGDGGTTFRFILPYLCLKEGEYVLTGTERMNNRPTIELVTALQQLGAEIEYTARDGYPPLRIKGGSLQGGTVTLDVSRSSQFASALLLVAPFMVKGLRMTLSGDIVSESYIAMTLNLMAEVGIKFTYLNQTVEVPCQHVSGGSVSVERDWSSAAFWFLLVAITRNFQCRLKGLKISSIQGDKATAEFFARLGVISQVDENDLLLSATTAFQVGEQLEFDLKSTPDVAPALIAACFALRQPARFTGVAHLRYKESDRIEVLKDIFLAAGARVVVDSDEFQLLGFPDEFKSVVVDPVNDHRIAMAFAMLGAAGLPFRISHPEVVQKSYPEFWNQLLLSGFPDPII